MIRKVNKDGTLGNLVTQMCKNVGLPYIELYCNDLEEKALEQFENLKNHPRVWNKVIAMPDAHCGYGMPIGGVCYLKRAISPNMVGADIGCGVMSVETNLVLSDLTTENIKKIMSGIRARVPMGFKWRETRLVETLSFLKNSPYCQTLYDEAMLQLGTLGGGNHFIEIQKDENDHIWFMIHCGSRNLGKKTGDFYNELAKQECLARDEEYLVKQDLTYLNEGTEAFKNYVKDEWTCVKFAQTNRNCIADLINEAFKEVYPQYQELSRTDCKHNYAETQDIEGVGRVYLHRKGAVRISQKSNSLIAGSQGTSSYMVKATPNAEKTFWTCSHGAGRCLGRMKAVKELDLAKEKQILESQGIIHSIRTQQDLEEATSAYKDIEKVIEQEKEFIEIVHKFKPIAVLKGN